MFYFLTYVCVKQVAGADFSILLNTCSLVMIKKSKIRFSIVTLMTVLFIIKVWNFFQPIVRGQLQAKHSVLHPVQGANLSHATQPEQLQQRLRQ